MNIKEAYSKIESIIADLRRNEQKIEKKQWVLLSIGGNELLYCDGCYADIQQERVHISVTNDSKKVLCEQCWEAKIKEEGDIK